jgi:2-isopropylmalate synthase
LYGFTTNINTKQIYNASRLISTITGVSVQPNKAIVGANAFAHEAGIHQHGVLANKKTYEIMTPESIGLPENILVLGKHSGKHAFSERLKDLGYALSDEQLAAAFEKFKMLADRKKEVSDLDLRALVQADTFEMPNEYVFDTFVINSGNRMTATAVVKLVHEEKTIEEAATGDGPVDAAFNAVERCVGESFTLEDGRQGRPGRGDRQARQGRRQGARPRPVHRRGGGQRQGVYRRDQQILLSNKAGGLDTWV